MIALCELNGSSSFRYKAQVIRLDGSKALLRAGREAGRKPDTCTHASMHIHMHARTHIREGGNSLE